MMSFASVLETVDAEGRFGEDELRRARSEALLLSLARVLRRVSEPGDPEAAFDQILEDAIEITDSEYGYVGQVCRDGDGDDYLRVVAAQDVTGLEGRDEFFARSVAEGLEFRDAETPFAEPLITDEVATVSGGISDAAAETLPVGHPPIDAIVAVPVHHAGSMIGMLALCNRAGGYPAELIEDIEPLRMTVANLLRHRVTERALARRRRALEHMNVELQAKNEEIRRMYHTLCHELKTPLTSVREFVSLMRDGIAGPLTADQADYLDETLQACDELTRHVNDLVDMTRMETGKLSCHSAPDRLGPVVERCVSACRAEAGERGISLSCTIDPALPPAEFDTTRISQVVSNLLSNAIKFTSARGTVTVDVRRWPSDASWLEVSVTDTGRGMEAAELSKIFDRLYQVSEADWSTQGGLGLGLHLSREIVRMHGGRILAESSPGAGSRFAFTLPASDVLVMPPSGSSSRASR